MDDEITFKDFQHYYPYAPTALSIKECVRLRAMKNLRCPGPILDVGCGDGLFARLAFGQEEVWGIDIDGNEGRHAQASRAYSHILLADITNANLPINFFGSCVANCSLEHIPDLDAALATIQRSLRPGATCYAFLPNRDWAEHLLSSRLLDGVGLHPWAKALREAIDDVFKHAHLEDAEGWTRFFVNAGFEVTQVEPVGSTRSTVAFEAFLLPALLGRANKALTGRWTLWPAIRSMTSLPVYALVKSILSAPLDRELTAEFLVCARRPGGEG